MLRFFSLLMRAFVLQLSRTVSVSIRSMSLDFRSGWPSLRLRGIFLPLVQVRGVRSSGANPSVTSRSIICEGSRMVRLHARSKKAWSSTSEWDLEVLWRPCGTSSWPEWANHSAATQGKAVLCEYGPTQRVLAFAKSGDAKRGFLLLTRSGEIGIYTQRGFQTASFPWQELRVDRWHSLRAVGSNGSTTFYCNGQQVAKIPSEPDNHWPERFCGDIDARNPQGAGLVQWIRFQVQENSGSCQTMQPMVFPVVRRPKLDVHNQGLKDQR